ncbi:MAG: adenylate/guanylate cyclase domain-containing protein [Desulfobacterales bacterium]
MTTAARRRRPAAAALVGLAFVAALTGFHLLPGIFEIWNLRVVDQLYELRNRRLAPAALPKSKVVHLDLTNSSVAAFGTRYLNRAHFARVIENLHQMKVDAQLWDFIFAQPRDPARDQAMIEATQRAGNVFFGAAFRLSEEPVAAPVEESGWALTVDGDPSRIWSGTDPLLTFRRLADAARGLGSISIRFDRDGVLRRIPLLVRRGERFFPSLPLAVACDQLQVKPRQILVRPGDAVYLKDAHLADGSRQTLRLPIDDRGNFLVNFIGGWERFDHYNLADVFAASDDRFEMEMWAKELEGKIVVVSDVSTGASDIGPVPGDPAFPLSGVHAQVIDSILRGSFLEELKGPASFLVDLAVLLVVMALALFAPSVAFSLGMAAVGAAYVAIAAGVFLQAGLILNVIRPSLFVLLASVVILVFRYVNEEREKLEGLRQRDLIRATFGRYLSNEVVEEILDAPEGLQVEGELREVTFLVSDLRGFTALSGELSPQRVIEILNRYLAVMVDIVSRFGGTVSELQGDGLLVYFGAPILRGQEAERAVACALSMQNALAEINREQRQGHLPELSMGIGIETGQVVVGSIGSEARAKYTAVGSPVNTAFRIESITVGGQVLIGESTRSKVAGVVSVRRQMDVELKGIADPLRLYEVVGIGGSWKVDLAPAEPDPLQQLQRPVTVRVQGLDAKEVSGAPLEAVIVATGRRCLEVVLSEKIPVNGSLRIRLAESGGDISDAYATVSSVAADQHRPDRFRVLLRITWIPEKTRRFLDRACGMTA